MNHFIEFHAILEAFRRKYKRIGNDAEKDDRESALKRGQTSGIRLLWQHCAKAGGLCRPGLYGWIDALQSPPAFPFSLSWDCVRLYHAIPMRCKCSLFSWCGRLCMLSLLARCEKWARQTTHDRIRKGVLCIANKAQPGRTTWKAYSKQTKIEQHGLESVQQTSTMLFCPSKEVCSKQSQFALIVAAYGCAIRLPMIA